jgi:UDP-N-acetylglucosamine--N-acetylmuramyl-(pentapeptide) pyrophosphoryl-undecaprenol N-acetylglucosamine transferase
VAQELRRAVPAVECLFLGSRDGMEAQILPRAGLALHAIPSRGFRRLGLRGRLLFFWSLVRGLLAASRLVRRWRPDLVVATGGHASLAGGLAAVLWRRTLVVQEQNRIPGFATRLLSRPAQRVYAGFPGTERAFAHPERVRCLGNPVRAELGGATPPSRPGDVPVLLVLGGSRGARSINRAVGEAIPLLAPAHRVRWLWQTGRLDHDALAAAWKRTPGVEVRAYLDDMRAAYAAACLVVCRSGAMTLAEITACGKAAILVPFPGAVDDHQTANARYLVEAGAAVLLPDAELSGVRLAREIGALLVAPERLEAMARRSAALARPDAARALVDDVLALLGHGARGEEHVRAG